MSGNSLEELSPYMQKGWEEQRQWVEAQKRRRAEVGNQMNALLADEKWETYRRHVEELKKFHVKRLETLESTILNTLAQDNDAVRKTRTDYLVVKARVESFNECLTVVGTLIKNAEINNLPTDSS